MSPDLMVSDEDDFDLSSAKKKNRTLEMRKRLNKKVHNSISSAIKHSKQKYTKTHREAVEQGPTFEFITRSSPEKRVATRSSKIMRTPPRPAKDQTTPINSDTKKP